VGTIEGPTEVASGSWTADEALSALYAAHWRGLVRLAWLLVRDQQVAEDVAQEAFVATYRRWSSLRSTDTALAYLRTATVNGSRSALRHRVVRQRHARAESPQSLAELRLAPSAESSALHRDQRDRIMALISDLPLRQREVLVLRYYLDLDEAAIATSLGISRGSVKTHASRGISALRSRMGDTFREEDRP
jgi:RNA polymerase sigma-70 factor (sigma-E family)